MALLCVKQQQMLGNLILGLVSLITSPLIKSNAIITDVGQFRVCKRMKKWSVTIDIKLATKAAAASVAICDRLKVNLLCRRL